MSPFQRHRWFVAAAAITLAFAAVCLIGHKSLALTAFADLTDLLLMLLAAGIALANAKKRPPAERSFWVLMAIGFGLWASNTLAWTWVEVIRRSPIPDPFFFDVVLFFHAVPMIAAVGWRPDIVKPEGRVHTSALNFLMLLGWWIFLYAFVVFPYQYIAPNARPYNLYYDRLYGLENLLLLGVLGLAVITSIGGWRRLYLHFLIPALVYAVNSQFLDRAAANNSYYSGSLFDIPLITTVSWMAAAALSARHWELQSGEFHLNPSWKKLVPRLAMLTILSLPALGVWTFLFDRSPAPARVFRIYAVLGAMLTMGTFLFLRQFFQDQALVALLRESRRGYESQKRLQSQLVQKEKLASLGTLVAGAASEINHPLADIMTSSERLWGKEGLSEAQKSLVRKIVQQASRTRDLVANLLSFAQQSPGQKQPVDLTVLLHRAAQMLEPRRADGRIRISVEIAPDLPRVLGNPHQLFQVFVEIIENATDAVEETGGGAIEIRAQRQGSNALLEFSDTGPGIREPQRVFDPFYTTKPIGKGTGLGLSVVYGVIQDHGGQITCQNKPEGGALVVIRMPATAEPAVQTAGASGD